VARRDEIISLCGRNSVLKQSLAERSNNFQAVSIDCMKCSNFYGVYIHTLFQLFPNILPLNLRCSFQSVVFFSNACKQSFIFWQSETPGEKFLAKKLGVFKLFESLLIEGLFLKCIHHFESLLLECQRKRSFTTMFVCLSPLQQKHDAIASETSIA